MKRSEMIIKMQRFYGIRHCMFEGKYITLEEFMTEMLDYIEHLGMAPPPVSAEDQQAIMHVYMDGNVRQWDEDLAKDEKVQKMKIIRTEAAKRREIKAKERAQRRAAETKMGKGEGDETK
jgi:hypothetical protein